MVQELIKYSHFSEYSYGTMKYRLKIQETWNIAEENIGSISRANRNRLQNMLLLCAKRRNRLTSKIKGVQSFLRINTLQLLQL